MFCIMNKMKKHAHDILRKIDHPDKMHINPTPASFHESIVNTVKAGLLACNIFTVLPIAFWCYSGQ